MTLNGLNISDRVIQRFLCNCQQHYEEGKGPPVYRARAIFFENLRQDYSVNNDIVPNLEDLNAQLSTWEVEAQTQAEAT